MDYEKESLYNWSETFKRKNILTANLQKTYPFIYITGNFDLNFILLCNTWPFKLYVNLMWPC